MSSKNIAKYKLVFDILYDEDKEFFHDNITIKTLVPCRDKILETIQSNKYGDIDFFYKYWVTKINIDIKVMLSDEQSLHVDVIKELIHENDKENILNDFSLYHVHTVLGHEGGAYIALSYAHKYKTILDILSSKKYSFIVSSPKNMHLDLSSCLESRDPIENITCKTSLSGSEDILTLFSKFPRFDIGEFNIFLENYETVKNRKESLIINLDSSIF